MTIDFGMLPPEINSARMYSGPGGSSLVTSASRWAGLATELRSAARSFESVIAGLAGGVWLGPASSSMARAGAPYVMWLNTTAAVADETAVQAVAAATAYDTAFTLTVPPPLVAANRAQLAALIATNLLGQNTSAIAANEALYSEMWAQDAVAMYGYAGSSAAASRLTPFTSPPPTTSPGGLAGQAAAVTAEGSHASMVISALPQALQSLASPAASTSSASGLTLPALGSALTALIGSTPAKALLEVPSVTSTAASSTSASASSASVGVGTRGLAATQDLATSQEARGIIRGGALGPSTGPGPAPAGSIAAYAPSPVTAGLGRAPMIGSLSVPQGWAIAAPETRLVATQLVSTSLGAAPAAAESGAANLFSEMALASMTGRALGGGVGPGSRERLAAITAHGDQADSPQTPAGVPGTGIEAELRQLVELRDGGHLTEREFGELKGALIKRLSSS